MPPSLIAKPIRIRFPRRKHIDKVDFVLVSVRKVGSSQMRRMSLRQRKKMMMMTRRNGQR